jgi:hypothetical protein
MENDDESYSDLSRRSMQERDSERKRIEEERRMLVLQME